jgi:hypothetical protein
MDEVVVKNGNFNVQRGPKKYASKIRTGICFYKYQTHSRVEEHPLKVYTLGQFLQHCKWVCHGMSQNYNSQNLLVLYQTSLSPGELLNIDDYPIFFPLNLEILNFHLP